MSLLDQIVTGEGEFKTIRLAGGRAYTFKEVHDHIFCADGAVVSVQASHTCYCSPRTDRGPYTTVEVGYPTVDPPKSWAQYADGEYPSTIYAFVPIALVREFIEAHGGEATPVQRAEILARQQEEAK